MFTDILKIYFCTSLTNSNKHANKNVSCLLPDVTIMPEMAVLSQLKKGPCVSDTVSVEKCQCLASS